MNWPTWLSADDAIGGIPDRGLSWPTDAAYAEHTYDSRARVSDVLDGGHGGARCSRASALRAAIAVGYGMSLRPGEYLDNGTTKSIASQLNASNCFFAFGEEVIVCVCDPHPNLRMSFPRPSSPSCTHPRISGARRADLGRCRWREMRILMDVLVVCRQC